MRLTNVMRFVVVICGIQFLSLVSPAVTAAEPVQVVLGTATKGGGFQLFGQTLVEVVNEHPGGIKLTEQPTKGSKENLPLLEQGKIDMGLVEGNAARQALVGIDREPTRLKVLAVMYPNPGMFVVRADSSYQTIADLKGKVIAFGTRASGLRILARDVLDGLGLNPEQDFQPVILDKAGDGPRMVLDKEVDALWGAGIGWPGFVKVAAGPNGARFIAPSHDQIKQILHKHPHLKTMSIPAGTYTGQDKQIDSVGLWSLILVRPDLPEKTVYQLARAIHRSEAKMAQQLKQGAYTTAKNTVQHVDVTQLHPGAARYYREAGLLK
ncbi:MAG: TAXI family TRAP transporter solute-binding subunit [Gammaproteobacteria bacterium]|nr:TAXI family TRAP transporter solute-binding subunit [Gammaproteobacteria bacterium]MDH5653720.1 TAXI family TRAP transporter solute-binding subunit [Gammaproteobacteria bacterium]